MGPNTLRIWIQVITFYKKCWYFQFFLCSRVGYRIAPLPDESNPYVQIFQFLVKVGKAEAAFTVTNIQKLCPKVVEKSSPGRLRDSRTTGRHFFNIFLVPVVCSWIYVSVTCSSRVYHGLHLNIIFQTLLSCILYVWHIMDMRCMLFTSL